jgi:HEAT repeat protein
MASKGKSDRESEPEIALLIERCHGGDTRGQIVALQRLEELCAYDALSAVIELLSSPDEIVRSTAAEALGALGDREPDRVGPALLRLLDDPDMLPRNDAVESLGALRYQPARESLERGLRADPDWVVRASAAEALGCLGDDRALDALVQALDDEYAPVRGYATDAIGLLGTPELIPPLDRYLRIEWDLGAKFVLAGALYRLGSPQGLA